MRFRYGTPTIWRAGSHRHSLEGGGELSRGRAPQPVVIRDAEIRRIAGAAGVAPRIVELDYVLGWALRGIASHESLADQLIFKGGTCLRKGHFPRYRFSEDLDFTAVRIRVRSVSGWPTM